MRTVRYSVAASLDGFIAGPNGEYDWIPPDDSIDFGELYGGVDTLLMGRKTYEAAQTQEGGGPFADMNTVLFSSTVTAPTKKNVTLVRRDAGAAVQELKRAKGGDIWLFGGGALFASLMAEGVVDEVEVAVCPVLLGVGIPLTPALKGIAQLKLIKERRHQSGIMMLRYALPR